MHLTISSLGHGSVTKPYRQATQICCTLSIAPFMRTGHVTEDETRNLVVADEVLRALHSEEQKPTVHRTD